MTQHNAAHYDADTPPYYGPDRDEDEIDLGELFAIIAGGKWWIGATTFVAVLFGAFYAWTAERMYPADALVQVEQQQQGLGSMLSEELGEMLGGETPVAAEVELLKSRMVVGRVVDELNLTVHAEPLRFPLIGDALARGWTSDEGQRFAAPWFGFDAYAWGGESITLSRLDVPNRLVGKPLTLVARDGDRYDLIGPDGDVLAEGGAVGAQFEADTRYGPVSVFVQEMQARPGTRFAAVRRHRNRVIAQLTSALSVSEQGRQSGILKVSLEAESAAEAAEKVNRIVQAYQRQNVERRSEEAEQTLSFVRQQLPEIRETLRAAESQLNEYRSEQGSADLTKETEIVLQQNVELEQKRLELQQRRQEALRRFTADHPVIESIDAQLRRLESNLDEVSGQVRNLPETQRQLLRLTRDVEVNTQLYTSLLNTAQELQVARAGTVGNVRIVDQAVESLGPSKPRSGLILALSGVLGLMLGVVYVFIRRAMQRGVLEPGEVEREVGLATYASIPFSPLERKLDRLRIRKKAAGGQSLLAITHPQDVCTEALRSLRTALHFALLDAPNRMVVITGPSPGLGKSFVSLNFAAVLAEAGQRVLVVDADLRRGHMHRIVGVPRAPGLTDCLSESSTLAESIHAVEEQPGLYFLTMGTLPPNPSELLMGEHFKEILAHIQHRFDYIIFDTPPVLAVTDAAIIGRLAGTTLMLLKEGEHPVPVLKDSLQRLRQGGVSVRGVVFNMVGRTPGKYGGHYGYRYGYTYTYKSVKK